MRRGGFRGGLAIALPRPTRTEVRSLVVRTRLLGSISLGVALGAVGCSMVFPATDYVGDDVDSTSGAGASGSTTSSASTSGGDGGGASGQGGGATTTTSGVGGSGGGVGSGGGGGAPGRIGRLFAIGGMRYELDLVTKDKAGVTATNFADVAADGSIGPWSYGPPVIDVGTYRADVRSGEIWLFGQTDGASGQKPALLQRAALDPVGLGEWQASYSSGLLVQLSMPVLGANHGYVATVDSQNPTANKIHRVELTPSGATLPVASELVGVTLQIPRKWSTPLVFGGSLLFIGGYSAQAMPTTRSDVEVFAIDAATGALTPQPSLAMVDGALPVQQRSTSVCADATRIYTVGGFVNSSTRHGKILRSVPTNGVPGNFARAAELPTARSGAACAIVGERLYVAGGVAPDGSVMSAVLWAPILPTGELGDWVTVGVNPLPFARSESELVFVPD
jgi:hypothetical protein